MNKRIVSMIRKLSKTEQEISLTELAEEFQISQRTESDRRVFLLSLVNYNPDAAREDVVQKQIAADEERNALPGKILYEQEHAHECFLSDSSFRKIQFLSELLTFGRYMKQKHLDPDSVKIQMLTRQFIEKNLSDHRNPADTGL